VDELTCVVLFGLQKLFDYIEGANEEGIKIPMTSPVKVDMEPSCGPFCVQNFTVSFYLPRTFQGLSLIHI